MKRPYITLLSALILAGCDFDDVPRFVPEEGRTEYRQEMRNLVQDISRYAKGVNADFIVIPHNGVELITTDGNENGPPDLTYLNAIDGINQDGVFYGGTAVDQPTPEDEQDRLLAFLDIARDLGAGILITDFAYSEQNIDTVYELAAEENYNAYVASGWALDSIPTYPTAPNNENNRDIDSLADADNFLNLTNAQLYSTPQELVDAISDTNYDLVIIDFFFNGEALTEEQIESLKLKKSGGRRLLLTTMNIGLAESNRYYWQTHWATNPPTWLREEDSTNSGSYYVNYWQQGWHNLLFGDSDDYLDRILNAGYDGVLLEGVEAYSHFEN